MYRFIAWLKVSLDRGYFTCVIMECLPSDNVIVIEKLKFWVICTILGEWTYNVIIINLWIKLYIDA